MFVLMCRILYGSFVKFLKRHGVYAQYNMLSTPKQNGVTKRHTQLYFNGHG